MQLKDLAKVSEVTSIIKETFNNFSNIPDGNLAKNKVIIEALAKSTKGYSNEVLIAAINQRVFTESQARQILQTTALNAEQIEAILSTSSLAASQVATTGTTIGLGTAFKGLWIQIKATTASMWAFLTTNPLGWATLAVTAIAGVALGIKKYNDSLEEAKQKIRETAEESKSAVKTIKSDFDELSSTTDNIKQRYAQLAQGVENLGKVNQSRGSLSNDEYAEFLDLSNQLAELFPQLTVNYDENGNAILGLSGNVNTIVGSLNDLVSVQQKLANQEIMKNMPDIWAGFMLDDEEFDRELKSSEKAVENHLKWAEEIKKRSTLTLTNESDNNLLVNAAKEAGIMDSRYGNDFYNEKHTASEYAANSFDSAEWDFTKLSDEQFNKLLDKLGEFGAEYEDTVQIVKGNIASANSGMASYINTWLSTEWNFNKMDSDMQNVIKSMLQSGDWVDLIPETVDASNWDEVSNWLQNEFLYEINKVQDNEEISKALSEIFTNQDLTPKEKADYIKQVQDYFGEGHAITLSLTPELEVTEDLEKQSQDAINFAKEKFDGYDPTEFFKKHSINTQEEIDAWRKIVEGAESATETEKEYLNQERTNNIPAPLSISDTVTQLNTKLKPAMDSLHSAWQDMFNDDGKFDLNSIDILSTCDTIKSKLDEMSDPEGLNLDVDYSAFEDFVRVLNNTESTEQDVENAFDSLATSITQAALSGTEDFETMKAALEDLGVVNETIIAFQALAENTDALKESGLDLANATYAQLEAFAREKLGAEDAAQGVAILVYQQMLVAENPLDTMASIQALANLGGKSAETAGILAELAQIMAQISNLQTWMANNPGGDASLVEATLGGLERKAEKLKSQIYTGVDFENVGGGTSSASKAGSKAADAYLEAFQKEYDHLKDLLDRGEISEAQYLNRLRALYNKYFKDRKEYLDEYKKYESEYLSGMLDLHNKALSGISTLLGNKISAANDAKDAAISALEEEKEAAAEAYQAQIDAIEEEKDAIDDLIKEKDKKIDALNEEADAIQKAADTRKKNIDLQKEEADLERMLNQRTTAVYKEGKGFVFEADTTGIRDAREKVKEAKEELEIDRLQREADLIQKEIDLLEEKKDALTEEQEAIQKMLDESNKYYDNLIKQQEKMWDSMIKGMEQQKSKWEELADIQQIAEAYSAVQQVFGELGYSVEDVLNGSESAFEDFKSKYISLIHDVNNNSDFTDGLTYATGVAKENLGSFLDKTKETGEGIDELAAKGTELNTVAEGMGNLSSTASDANTNLAETATKTDEVAENVGIISEGLNQLPESGKVSGLAGEFETLAEKIGEVAQSLGISEGADINTLFQAMTELNDVILGNEGEGIIGQFTLLKNAITDVIETIGFAEEQTVGSLMTAIIQLNSITLDESIIAQFDNLKAAIDSVTSAISGGGESSDGEGQSGNSVSGKGGESGSKGSNGEGGRNSLTGAITSIGDTAKEVIGEPDAEGDGTVIGEFGAMETAINDVTTAIVGGESEGGEGSGGESDGNLIDSIVSLGETTEEILGEPDGNGIIGRFGEFKDVIAEANEQVTGISDGLAAIDGQTVECTIKINIDSDGFPSYAAGTALGAMNLESAEYNAKYEGNAHVTGTANVTGNWGVRKPGKSLVGEVGQEIWVHSADGTFETVGDNGPEWIKTEKGDLIFNHLQTKELLDKGNIVKTGKAYASGTIQYSDGTVIQPDGSVLRPLQPGDKMWDMYHAFDAYLKSIDGNLEKLVPNSFYEQNRQMNEVANFITNSSIVNNNHRPSVNIGDINVTCPGVTSQQVAEQIGSVIGKELDRQFNGFHNYTDQRSRVR